MPQLIKVDPACYESCCLLCAILSEGVGLVLCIIGCAVACEIE